MAPRNERPKSKADSLLEIRSDKKAHDKLDELRQDVAPNKAKDDLRVSVENKKERQKDVVKLPKGLDEMTPYDFARWVRKLEKSPQKLAATLEDAYQNNPDLARAIENQIDSQDANEKIVKASYDAKNDVIDGAKASELRKEAAESVKNRMLEGMTEEELHVVSSNTQDAQLKRMSDQRIAALKLEELNESIA